MQETVTQWHNKHNKQMRREENGTKSLLMDSPEMFILHLFCSSHFMSNHQFRGKMFMISPILIIFCKFAGYP